MTCAHSFGETRLVIRHGAEALNLQAMTAI